MSTSENNSNQAGDTGSTASSSASGGSTTASTGSASTGSAGAAGSSRAADAVSQVAAAFTSVDTQRVTELKNAASLLAIDTNALNVEVKRLTAKYGATDPRVLALTARIGARAPLDDSLKQEITRSSIKPTAYDPTKGGMVAGRVFDAKSQAMANVTVYLADANKKSFSGLSSCTDGNGYYSINFNTDQAGQFKDNPPYLVAADSTGKNIFTGKSSLLLPIGSTTYQNIYLGDNTCAAPPDASAGQKPTTPDSGQKASAPDAKGSKKSGGSK